MRTHTHTHARARARTRTPTRRRYQLPLIVTESGIADGDAHDERRVRYLSGCLRAVHAALADGVDVRGYTYWSLLDNFECAEAARTDRTHRPHAFGPGPDPWPWPEPGPEWTLNPDSTPFSAPDHNRRLPHRWAEGFRPRFGLYRVDYATLARSETAGLRLLRDVVHQHRQRASTGE